MWQLFDIAYVIPTTVFLGYWAGKFLEEKYSGEYMTYSIMTATVIGFILTIYKIKRFVDQQNSKIKQNKVLK